MKKDFSFHRGAMTQKQFEAKVALAYKDKLKQLINETMRKLDKLRAIKKGDLLVKPIWIEESKPVRKHTRIAHWRYIAVTGP